MRKMDNRRLSSYGLLDGVYLAPVVDGHFYESIPATVRREGHPPLAQDYGFPVQAANRDASVGPRGVLRQAHSPGPRCSTSIKLYNGVESRCHRKRPVKKQAGGLMRKDGHSVAHAPKEVGVQAPRWR